MPDELPQGHVTFRGRGAAFVHGTRVVVTVCPLCSQRNARRGAERGVCEWCAYVPSRHDIETAVDAPARERN